ncbi:Ppx/GppA family phosphatase [Varunaivibrio sulfuroxidans]|uniref:Exopolyphosphatase/guanosine-5'-triphosphate, 3'-diphosphate pyrophosphatase n=1 Tax=Varunaivibrio sulfuroxidans TaxID=1773489 RepID=A0A4R3J4Y5_9PROT|nr:Ppx/GppA family phosphatase [Varunaivibrio sulfuroxidans]TCS60367.1 exopolyphosphatase/guanosine-5'-triphosphate,3'-diphosphate pyrophosphatase [Varunaivibrio sulfuroxidans]WES30945.1 Ppx/GppA family phosphatase [Varunaivibrio sulfuroxidans]
MMTPSLRILKDVTVADPEGRGLGKIAVIDIGSNTVRLVVYDAPTRLPIPMFNEKVQCALGLGLADTGKLNPEGVEMAVNALVRFVNLSRAMGVDHLEIVATAAVREAEDGPDFVRRIHALLNHEITVLSGEEEAKLAAYGLLSGTPDADGVIGDLGGGSLDLVVLNHGTFGEHATFPLGHLRLRDAAGGKPENAGKVIEGHLEGTSWMKKIKGRTLYAVGGSWRAIARIMIDQTHYPLHVIDNYTIEREEALRLLQLIGKMSSGSIAKIPGVPKKRVETLPYAAIALGVLLEQSGAAQVTFSGYGMREGQLLQCLPERLRRQDPLISASKTRNERTGRFRIKGREIRDWMEPLFPDITYEETRILYAACLLGDLGWNEHPDYRAEHAFYRILRIPFAGLTHPERALLAISIYVRYNGNSGDSLVRSVGALLSEDQIRWCDTVGLALRLAHTLSGSAPGILAQTHLRNEDNTLILGLPQSREAFVSEMVERRLKTLAKSLGEGKASAID